MWVLNFGRTWRDTLGFGGIHVFFLVGALLIGSCVEFRSLAETTLRHLDQETLSTDLDSNAVYTNMTAQLIRNRRSSDVAHLNILGRSDLPALKDFLSDRKITVRLGLRIAFRGPNELLEPQLRLLLNKQPGLYNVGNKAGLFSMRVLGIKKGSTTS